MHFNPSSGVPSRAPWKWSRTRRCYLVAILAPLAVMGFFLIQTQVLKHRVEVRRRELTARGEVLTLVDIASKRAAAGLTNTGEGEFLSASTNLTEIICDTSSSCTGLTHSVLWRKELTVGELAGDGMFKTTPLSLWMDQHLPDNQKRLDQMIQAIDRPGFCYNFDYENMLQKEKIPIFHLIESARWLQLAMYHQLHRNNAAEACRLLCAQIRYVRFRPEGNTFFLYIGHMAIGSIVAESTWQALQYPDWNDAQLAEIQAAWESVEFPPALERTIVNHRASQLELIAMLRANATLYQNEIVPPKAKPLNCDVLSCLLANICSVDFMPGRRLYLRTVWKCWNSHNDELRIINTTQEIADILRSLQSGDRNFATAMRDTRRVYDRLNPKIANPNPYTRFTELAILPTMTMETFSQETRRRMALVAIALARHRLAHGQLPASLDELVPGYLPRKPVDPMDGQSLRYRPNPDGTFLLYSAGFNGRDDGGVRSSWNGEEDGTDLFWPMPDKP